MRGVRTRGAYIVMADKEFTCSRGTYSGGDI